MKIDKVRLLDKIRSYGDACARARAAEIDYGCCRTAHDRRELEKAEDRTDEALKAVTDILADLE